MTTGHPSLEQLNELADRELARDSATAVERHVAACDVCRATLARLRALLERTATLPRSVDPPPEVWPALRARITRHAPAIHRSRPRWAREWGLRAAAAVLLVVGSSAVTVLALRSRDAVRDAASPPRAGATPATSAAVIAVERSYAEVVDELTATFETQRGALAPETIATLERSLRVIDEAIAEARAALAADPANDAIVDVLSANYEQKVQLLRRASELRART
ncbi:MAG: zf-HC2 domain-containing protein [Gemmatimonadaceae bacterium]